MTAGDQGAERRTLAVRVLDTRVSLTGPSEIVETIGRAYVRFRDPDPGTPGIRIEVAADGRTLESDGRRIELAAGVDPAVQVYRWFIKSVLDSVGAYAVLHAGALVSPRDGRAVLLAAPSGHGKTGLTLELVARGFRFLSDDYAPLDPDRRVVHPYWRAVNVRPEAAGLLPEPARAALASAPPLFDKRLLDVGALFGDAALCPEPVALGHVILLTAGPPDRDPAGESETRLGLILRRDAEPRLLGTLEGMSGVEIESRVEREDAVVVGLRLDAAGRPAGPLDRLLEDEGVLYTEKRWCRRPDFTARPESAPIPRRDAAMALAREMLNRSPSSRFLARYGGSATRMFLDLAEAVAGARCHGLRVGAPAATADRIEQLCGEKL
jgi:hypothetical protein